MRAAWKGLAGPMAAPWFSGIGPDVLDGTFAFTCGDLDAEAKQGACVMVPRARRSGSEPRCMMTHAKSPSAPSSIR